MTKIRHLSLGEVYLHSVAPSGDFAVIAVQAKDNKNESIWKLQKEPFSRLDVSALIPSTSSRKSA